MLKGEDEERIKTVFRTSPIISKNFRFAAVYQLIYLFLPPLFAIAKLTRVTNCFLIICWLKQCDTDFCEPVSCIYLRASFYAIHRMQAFKLLLVKVVVQRVIGISYQLHVMLNLAVHLFLYFRIEIFLLNQLKLRSQDLSRFTSNL